MIEPFTLQGDPSPKLLSSLIGRHLRLSSVDELELNAATVSSFGSGDVIAVHWEVSWTFGQGFLVLPNRKNSFGQPLIFQPRAGSFVVFSGSDTVQLTRSTELKARIYKFTYA